MLEVYTILGDFEETNEDWEGWEEGLQLI